MTQHRYLLPEDRIPDRWGTSWGTRPLPATLADDEPAEGRRGGGGQPRR